MSDTKRFVGMILDAETGDPVKLTNNPQISDGVVRIHPNGRRAEPVDLWIHELREMLDEIEEFDNK